MASNKRQNCSTYPRLPLSGEGLGRVRHPVDVQLVEELSRLLLLRIPKPDLSDKIDLCNCPAVFGFSLLWRPARSRLRPWWRRRVRWTARSPRALPWMRSSDTLPRVKRNSKRHETNVHLPPGHRGHDAGWRDRHRRVPREVFDVLYDDKGKRMENVVFAPQSRWIRAAFHSTRAMCRISATSCPLC